MSVSTTVGSPQPVPVRAETASPEAAVRNGKSASDGSAFASALMRFEPTDATVAGEQTGHSATSGQLISAMPRRPASATFATDPVKFESLKNALKQQDINDIESEIEYFAELVPLPFAATTESINLRSGSYGDRHYAAPDGDSDLPARRSSAATIGDFRLRPGPVDSARAIATGVQSISRGDGNAPPSSGNELPAAGRNLPPLPTTPQVPATGLAASALAALGGLESDIASELIPKDNAGSSTRTVSPNAGNALASSNMVAGAQLDGVVEVGANRSAPVPIAANFVAFPSSSKLSAAQDQRGSAKPPAGTKVESLFLESSANTIRTSANGRPFIPIQASAEATQMAFSMPDTRSTREHHESAAPFNGVTSAGISSSSTSQSVNSPLAGTLSNTSNVPLENSVAAQISDRLVATVAQGGQTARLQLSPGDLGSLEMHIRIQDDGASVSIQASNPQARELIEASLPRLREMFAEQGMDLLDVDVSSHQDEGADNSEHSAPNSAPIVAETLADIDHVENLDRRRSQSRLIDVLA